MKLFIDNIMFFMLGVLVYIIFGYEPTALMLFFLIYVRLG
jgi:hypothetical protein